MDKQLINTENLTVGYRQPLIKDICLSVRSGEIMTLIGPNGSGKSTILKTLARELKSLGGAVYIDNTDTANIPSGEFSKKLSVLLTERINPNLMTCREVIETGRYPHTGYFGRLTAKDREAVSSAIEAVSIGDLADAYFSEISDGQRQRVMLARAICQEPEILILDEPTSYLDIHHKIAFIEILKRIVREKGIAVIMSMHEIEFAESISDYTVCIKDGKIIRQGASAEIFNGDTIKKLFDISDEMFEKYFNKKKGSTQQ